MRDYFLTYAAPRGAAHRLTPSSKALTKQQEELKKRIPTTMVMGEMDEAARHVRAGARRLSQPDARRSRPACRRCCRRCRRTRRQSPRPGAVAGRSRPSADRRVAVNRFWQMYFGIGLVKTPGGLRRRRASRRPIRNCSTGWPPSSSRRGWDVKAMQRLIVTSATYRQSSKRQRGSCSSAIPRIACWRAARACACRPRSIRDNALAVSGLLDDQLGGPSVMPYQPPGCGRRWRSAKGSRGRRTSRATARICIGAACTRFWKRTVPPASLATFDAPTREKCTARRGADQHAAAGAGAAERSDLRRSGAGAGRAGDARRRQGSTRARVVFAFRLAHRAPAVAARRLTSCDDLLDGRLTWFRRNPQAAAQAAVGRRIAARMPGSTPASWPRGPTVASIILNLDETITKQ